MSAEQIQTSGGEEWAKMKRPELACRGTNLSWESMNNRRMLRFAGARRFVFNRALALEQEIYTLCGFRPGYAELCEEMARSKEEPKTSLVDRSRPHRGRVFWG